MTQVLPARSVDNTEIVSFEALIRSIPGLSFCNGTVISVCHLRYRCLVILRIGSSCWLSSYFQSHASPQPSSSSLAFVAAALAPFWAIRFFVAVGLTVVEIAGMRGAAA